MNKSKTSTSGSHNKTDMSRSKLSGATRSTLKESNLSSKRSRMSMSKSTMRRRGGHHDKNKLPVVRDAEGHDVTPLSLLQGVTINRSKPPGDLTTSTLSETSTRSQVSDWDLMPSAVGMSSSILSTDDTSGTPGGASDDGSSTDEERPESVATSPRIDDERVTETGVDHETLTEEQLDALTAIQLLETETFFLLDIPGSCIAIDSGDAEDIKKRNETYQELKKNIVGNDMYVNRGMQTLNGALKVKDIQVFPTKTEEVACEASDWDIYDAYYEDEDEEKSLRDKLFKVEDILPPYQPGGTHQAGHGAPHQSTAAAPSGGALLSSTASQRGGGNPSDPTVSVTESNTGTPEQSMSQLNPNASVGMSTSHLPQLSSTASGVVGVQGGEMDVVTAGSAGVDTELQAMTDAIFSLPQFKWSLKLVDRAIMQNLYHAKHMVYRDWVPMNELIRMSEIEAMQEQMQQEISDDEVAPSDHGAEDEDGRMSESEGTHQGEDDGGARIELLWQSKCELTENRNVSCMSWNTLNEDLLAVGYGEFEFTKQGSGMILFWSLKNPEYPEHVIHTSFGVTALAFSATSPNLLAAGLYDGSVCIYDVRAQPEKPSLVSGHSSGKHSDPVWELKWVNRGNEGREVLVSISTDGRVTQWSLKKGLEHTDLIKLKRHTSQSKGQEGKSEGFISRRASGLCLDFYPKDNNIYLAGTEDGNIHKCSCSYNEQYLESYYGHTGPVYKVQCSPFAHNYFLSSSADWSIKLWRMEQETPVISFDSCKESIYDVCWSPTNSSVFATVNGNGQVDIWDLAMKNLDPVVSAKMDASRMSCVVFSRTSPVVLTGDNLGNINVFRLSGLSEPPDSQDNQVAKLETVLSPNKQSQKAE